MVRSSPREWPFLFAHGQTGNRVKYREPLQLFRNLEGKRSEEIATQAGLNIGALESRRGTAIGDINDGSDRKAAMLPAA